MMMMKAWEGAWGKSISQETKSRGKKKNPVADNPASLMSFLCGEKVKNQGIFILMQQLHKSVTSFEELY